MKDKDLSRVSLWSGGKSIMGCHKRVIYTAAVIASMLLVSACAFPLPMFDVRVQPRESDTSLISGKPCAPPCWYDIIPGFTDIETALEQVRHLEFVDPDSVERTSRDLYPGTDDSIRWNYSGTNDFGGDILIEKDIVKWLRVSHPNHFLLEDVLPVIGEPDWVWAGRAGGGGNHHIFRFIYEEEGLMLESRMYGTNEKMPERVRVKSDIEIDKAIYFAPQTLNQFLTDIRTVPDDRLQSILNAYQAWPGLEKEIMTAEDSPYSWH